MAETLKFRVGTRGSKLALAQTQEVVSLLEQTVKDMKVEVVKVSTSGDAKLKWNPKEGSFADEINRMVLEGELDAGVHSVKDLPSTLPEGLEIAAVPKRGSRLDCIVGIANYARLPSGSVVGTSSPRRKAQMLHYRRDLEIKELRGNVDTRLQKVKSGELDGIIIAKCGLDRLHYEGNDVYPLPLDYFVPAPGQGALALVTRTEALEMNARLNIEHRPTREEVEIERAVLRSLGTGCSTPLGITAMSFGNGFRLRVQLLTEDGMNERRLSTVVHSVEEAEETVRQLKG